MGPQPESNESAFNAITLRTLQTARWSLIGLFTTVALLTQFGSLDQEISRLVGSIHLVGWVPLLIAWCIASVALSMSRHRLARHRHSAGALLVGDALMVTAFLGFAGGASNPFTILYFVPLMLATQLSPRWAWIVAGVCVAGFGLLFVLGSGGHTHHFSGHLKGMWLAFAVSGVLITVVVHRMAIAIAQWRHELRRLREADRRNRELARVGSLSAGAAHQLGTPLATLTILVGELDSMTAEERSNAIDSMKGELARCKTTIAAMANSELRADALSEISTRPWPVAEIAEDFASEPLKIVLESGASAKVRAPRPAVVKILDELVANAKSLAGAVSLRIGSSNGTAYFSVDDDGDGMSAEVLALARDPFFTTREQAGHMGLGLFLADSQSRQLKGSLEIGPRASGGTSVQLNLPVASGGADS